jgi:hypothetical protein
MMRVSGLSLESVAEKFSLHRDAIWRHMRKHVPDDVKASYLCDVPIAELAERANKENLSLIDYLALVRGTVISQMLLAASANDGYRTAALAGRATDVLRQIGQVTGELSKLGGITITNNVAIFSDPKFLELQAGLLTIARSHPGARADIIALLRGLDAQPSSPKPNGAHALMIEGEANHAA